MRGPEVTGIPALSFGFFNATFKIEGRVKSKVSSMKQSWLTVNCSGRRLKREREGERRK
jgi:hypothetical protein